MVMKLRHGSLINGKTYFNTFDGAVSYRRNSLVYRPYGMAFQKENNSQTLEHINYAENKTKGAFAYVSNCASHGYKTVELMKQLSKYFHVDIYGKCTGRLTSCGRYKYECIERFHSQYHFYLSPGKTLYAMITLQRSSGRY